MQLCLLVSLLSIVATTCDSLAENRTTIASDARRFEKILHRRRRFLLFPPGSAIVTTLSFTKTLVPRSPSGINMVGECDIFYPLQTQISDWYLPTKKPPPPPPPPAEDYDDNAASDMNAEPPAPNPQPPPPVPITNDSPIPVSAPDSGQRPPDGQFKFPTDQELGISAGTLTNDPNFNVGKHPGEIYVNGRMPSRKRIPNNPNRIWPDKRVNKDKVASFSMDEDYLWKSMHAGAKAAWHPPQPFMQSTARGTNRFPNDRLQFKRNERMERHTVIRRRRAAMERRDLYEQFESIALFKNIDPKACISRIICETKHYLLPPGKSLFQDIFRVLFTLPDEPNELDDEYVQAMHSDEQDCRTKFAYRCRYSILGYLLSPERPIL